MRLHGTSTWRLKKHTYETLPDWRGVWRVTPFIPHAFDFSVSEDREDLPGTKRTTAELTPKYAVDYEQHIENIKAGLGWAGSAIVFQPVSRFG